MRKVIIENLIIETLENIASIKQYLVGRRKLSQAEMAKLSPHFTYSLNHGILMNIPIDKIDGLDPEPSSWVDDDGNRRQFEKKQKIKEPIEVEYDEEENIFYLQNGNHRIKQAKINGDSTILAFVQLPRLFLYDYIVRQY